MSELLCARLARRSGPQGDGASRREFLRATLVAGAGLLLSCSPRSATAPPGQGADRSRGKRV